MFVTTDFLMYIYCYDIRQRIAMFFPFGINSFERYMDAEILRISISNVDGNRAFLSRGRAIPETEH